MWRLASGWIVGVIAAVWVVAPTASASPALSDVKAALLSSAQAKKVTGTPDPLADSDTWCASPSTGRGTITCSRSWPGDEDGPFIPSETRIEQHLTSSAAARTFRTVVRDELTEASNVGVDPKVLTSMQSTVLFTVGSGLNMGALGYQRVGRVLVSVSCGTNGKAATVTGLAACARRLLAAQASKARPLSD